MVGFGKVLAAIGLGFVIASTAAAPASALPWGADVHHVRNDRGGYVIDYALRMKRMERAGRLVRFAGRCDSACTLFLALPRTQTCVSQGAAFGFHLPYGSSRRGNRVAASYLMNSYPGWVRSWLASNGGLSSGMKVMPYSYARQHLPECASGTVARRGGNVTVASRMDLQPGQ